ncbi:hypothetical protein ACFY4C_32935 [Actinomadura viridis]|uniref:hypothetical protein n=1 Tax=Actinomadura viridis TaxID=58110 RepID=UPI0036A04F3D
MTATAVREPSRTPAGRSPGRVLAGTGILTRLILRRERIKLPAWSLGITLLLLYFATVVSEATKTEEQLQDVRRFTEGTIGALFGPGYGRDDITAERYLAGVYGVFFFVLAALMSLLLVSRHTRGDEQNGRAELIRSTVVGRHAQLTAVLIVAVGANAALALLLAGAMAANGYDGAQGLLFGASVGAVGLVFAGITALTVQVTENSRSATGIAGAALGVAWVVRAVGDMTSDRWPAVVVLATGLVEPDPAVRGRPVVAAAAVGRARGDRRGGRLRAVGPPGCRRRTGRGPYRGAGGGAVAEFTARGRVPVPAGRPDLVDGGPRGVRFHLRRGRRPDRRLR